MPKAGRNPERARPAARRRARAGTRCAHLPPTRDRASSTITLPFCSSSSWRAAARPAAPAPTTTTSAVMGTACCNVRPGCTASPPPAAAGAVGRAPEQHASMPSVSSKTFCMLQGVVQQPRQVRGLLAGRSKAEGAPALCSGRSRLRMLVKVVLERGSQREGGHHRQTLLGWSARPVRSIRPDQSRAPAAPCPLLHATHSPSSTCPSPPLYAGASAERLTSSGSRAQCWQGVATTGGIRRPTPLPPTRAPCRRAAG